MHRISLACYFLVFGAIEGFSQEYAYVDEKVDAYPNSFISSEQLAERIQDDFESEAHQLRAAFRWIAKNIKYDVKQYFSPPKPSYRFYKDQADREKRIKNIHDELVSIVLKNKLAMCKGYSVLFQRVCSKMGIQTEVITGISKSMIADIGSERGSPHAWNAIKVDQGWMMADITWAAGYIDYEKLQFIPQFDEAHFLTHPEEFANTHYPNNPQWLMTKDSISQTDFREAPLFFKHPNRPEIKLISPKSGLVEIEDKEILKIKLSGMPEKPEVIALFGKKESQLKIWPKQEQGITTLRIKISKPMEEELYIYVNRLPLLGFRLTKIENYE